MTLTEGCTEHCKYLFVCVRERDSLKEVHGQWARQAVGESIPGGDVGCQHMFVIRAVTDYISDLRGLVSWHPAVLTRSGLLSH